MTSPSNDNPENKHAAALEALIPQLSALLFGTDEDNGMAILINSQFESIVEGHRRAKDKKEYHSKIKELAKNNKDFFWLFLSRYFRENYSNSRSLDQQLFFKEYYLPTFMDLVFIGLGYESKYTTHTSFFLELANTFVHDCWNTDPGKLGFFSIKLVKHILEFLESSSDTYHDSDEILTLLNKFKADSEILIQQFYKAGVKKKTDYTEDFEYIIELSGLVPFSGDSKPSNYLIADFEASQVDYWNNLFEKIYLLTVNQKNEGRYALFEKINKLCFGSLDKIKDLMDDSLQTIVRIKNNLHNIDYDNSQQDLQLLANLGPLFYYYYCLKESGDPLLKGDNKESPISDDYFKNLISALLDIICQTGWFYNFYYAESQYSSYQGYPYTFVFKLLIKFISSDSNDIDFIIDKINNTTPEDILGANEEYLKNAVVANRNLNITNINLLVIALLVYHKKLAVLSEKLETYFTKPDNQIRSYILSSLLSYWSNASENESDLYDIYKLIIELEQKDTLSLLAKEPTNVLATDILGLEGYFKLMELYSTRDE